jgi:hypothetical protein
VNAFGAAGAWSATWTFVVDTVATVAPVLTSPLDSAILTTLKPSLTWGAIPNAVQYEVQYSNNSSFDRVTTVTTKSTEYTFAQELSNSLHWWRVRALDAAGNPSVWSAARSFTPDGSLGSPLIACRTTSPTLTLTWERVSWATQYQYQVSTVSNFASTVAAGAVDSQATLPTVTTNSMANGRYFWRVRALATNGSWGAWSVAVSCTVDAP